MKKNKKNKPFLGIVKIFLFSISILILIQIYITHRLAITGELMANLENQAAKVTIQNEGIKEIINQKSSLSIVFEKAQILGFKPIEKIVYLTSEIPVAMNH